MTLRRQVVRWTLANAIGMALASAIFQWLLLRRRGVHAIWWLVLWIVGLPLGMIVFMFVYTLLDAVIVPGEQWSISWAGEIALYGLCIGGTAAAISGIPLFRAISLQAVPSRSKYAEELPNQAVNRSGRRRGFGN